MLTNVNISASLKATLQDVWGDEMEGKLVWTSCGFKVKNTKDAFVDDQEYAGTGLAPIKEEGAMAALDDIQEGYSKRYDIVTYALRGVVSGEALADSKYDRPVDMASALGTSMKLTQEFEGANTFIRAFSSSYIGSDLVALCSTAHLLPKGGTFSNMFATAMSLSELAVETMSVNMAKLPSSNGYITNGQSLKKLVIPEDLRFRAARILKSDGQNDTANNAMNVLKGMGIEIVANRYLTSTSNWFGISDAKNGLKWVWREKPQFAEHNTEDNFTKSFVTWMRFASGWTDPRGVYGSNI